MRLHGKAAVPAGSGTAIQRHGPVGPPKRKSVWQGTRPRLVQAAWARGAFPQPGGNIPALREAADSLLLRVHQAHRRPDAEEPTAGWRTRLAARQLPGASLLEELAGYRRRLSWVRLLRHHLQGELAYLRGYAGNAMAF